jgi:branched-chain amino acid transport system permease protein
MTIQLLNGLVYGGLLYVLSVGLVLIFGLRRVVNFAHGSLFMIGAYIGYSVAQVAGFFPSLLASVLVMALLGALLDICVFRPLQKEDPLLTVLVTFGLLMILEDFARTVWGKDFLSVQVPQILSGNLELFSLNYPIYRLMVIVLSLVIAIGLSAWLRWSSIGLFVRASSTDPVTTGMQGVNTDAVSAIVVAVGAALAGMAGVVASPLLALSPSMGSYILVECFIVVVVGGLSSFSGAFLAAMLIGQIHNLGIVYFPNVASAIPFLLMMGVLIWRPEGLTGKRVS